MAFLHERLVVPERAVDQDYRTIGLCHGGGQQPHAKPAAAEVHVQFSERGLDIPLGLGLGVDAKQVGALTPKKTKQNGKSWAERANNEMTFLQAAMKSVTEDRYKQDPGTR